MRHSISTLSILCLFALLMGFGSVSAQLTIVLDAIPSSTPAGADVYVAGDFQGWDPGAAEYLLTPNTDGDLSITISPAPGTLTFKFTRGSWATVEGNEVGQFLPDRTHSYTGGPETLNLEILSWEDQSSSTSTAAANVSVISTDYYIPQLDRNRRIWVYLPPDYDDTSLDYPVIYMHDGQNVFDLETSFAGEWEVDETLNTLHGEGDPGVIVVAIDNGGATRIDELSPWVNPDYGGGEGDLYMQFIINTLKPDIDATYRTLPGRESTALMGSSLGGLISHYGAVEYESTFSKVGIFSPSYWFAPESYTLVEQSNHTQAMRIYMIAGGQEGGNTVADAQSMYQAFLEAGYTSDELRLEVHPDGQHSEWYWAREFGDAYQWLFDVSSDLGEKEAATVKLYPNPAQQTISLSRVPSGSSLVIIDTMGREVMRPTVQMGTLDVSALKPGSYLLRVIDEDGQSAVERSFVKE